MHLHYVRKEPEPASGMKPGMSDPNAPMGPLEPRSRWEGNVKALFVMHVLVALLMASRLGNLWSAYGLGLVLGMFMFPLLIAAVPRVIYVLARSGRQPIWGPALLGMTLLVDAMLLLGFRSA